MITLLLMTVPSAIWTSWSILHMGYTNTPLFNVDNFEINELGWTKKGVNELFAQISSIICFFFLKCLYPKAISHWYCFIFELYSLKWKIFNFFSSIRSSKMVTSLIEISKWERSCFASSPYPSKAIVLFFCNESNFLVCFYKINKGIQ